MPKGKGKAIQEDMEASADVSDNEPNEWSDDGETSSNSGSNQDSGKNVDVLKELILHGFDVKGKLIDGKLSYIFRTPKTPVRQVVEEVPARSSVRASTMPTYVGGGSTHYGMTEKESAYAEPPPSYYNSSSVPRNRSVNKEKKKKHSGVSWFQT